METWERLQTRARTISGFPHKKGRRTCKKERSSLGGRRWEKRRRRRERSRRKPTPLRQTGKDAQKGRGETRRRALAATTLVGRGLTSAYSSSVDVTSMSGIASYRGSLDHIFACSALAKGGLRESPPVILEVVGLVTAPHCSLYPALLPPAVDIGAGASAFLAPARCVQGSCATAGYNGLSGRCAVCYHRYQLQLPGHKGKGGWGSPQASDEPQACLPAPLHCSPTQLSVSA
ncbi:hypothetical protein NDU88_004816 [Pleurodeles waltl]|uniref:Uncharacterized protein n=1 Tax=Pleurodeles waltl TaxID=8319 RepID=A0AAV7WWI6_PLEWA|nr:hypothetical protein NDU88_004816 [Pleurodeles waltl]